MSKAVKNRSLIYGVMILVLAIMVMRSLLESLNDNAQEQRVNNPPIGTQKLWIDKDKDSVVVYHHNRIWQNNYGNAYQSNLIVRHKDASQAIASHKIMNTEGSTNFWGALYAQMVQESSPKLDLILDAFYQIYQQQPMSAPALAPQRSSLQFARVILLANHAEYHGYESQPPFPYRGHIDRQ